MPALVAKCFATTCEASGARLERMHVARSPTLAVCVPGQIRLAGTLYVQVTYRSMKRHGHGGLRGLGFDDLGLSSLGFFGVRV